MKKEKSSLSRLFLSLWDKVLWHHFAIHVGIHAQVILGSTPVPGGIFKSICHEDLAVVRARVDVCYPQPSGLSLPPLNTQTMSAPLTNSITGKVCVKHCQTQIFPISDGGINLPSASVAWIYPYTICRSLGQKKKQVNQRRILTSFTK